MVYKVLCCFYGNAAVERGFSINKNCLQSNHHEQSLVARRLICDEIFSVGGNPADINITNEMLTNCKHARTAYETYLEKKAKNKEEKVDSLYAKRKIEEELKEAERKKEQTLQEQEKDIMLLKEKLKKFKRD